MTTAAAAELRALADRVEAGEALQASVIGKALGVQPKIHTRTTYPENWGYGTPDYSQPLTKTREVWPPYLASLDAAASTMPEGWRVVTVYETAFGKISASYAHRKRGWGASGTAPTECCARVAAALRAMAYMMEAGV